MERNRLNHSVSMHTDKDILLTRKEHSSSLFFVLLELFIQNEEDDTRT